MTSKERVIAAYEFRSADKIPLELHPSRCGLYEHGERLKEQLSRIPGDFEDVSQIQIPVPDPADFDSDGRYHSIKEDEWGVTWEYRIFQVAGHPLKRPLDDISLLKDYRFPDPAYGGRNTEATNLRVKTAKEAGLFCKVGWFTILERLVALRRFEDVLMDIIEDTDEINALADLLVEYYEQDIKMLIDANIDAVGFGDDYGTQNSLIISQATFRNFIKPRIKRLIKPFKDAGIKVHFHSCGYVYDILPDLKEIGVDSIWPQLSVYDLQTLSDTCHDLDLAVALHIDRAGVMTNGTPELVRETFHKMMKIFKPQNGGSWIYVEIDNGFPFENIVALVDEIEKYRGVK